MDLWSIDDPDVWHREAAAYDDVIDAQGVARLPELDRWYQQELPETIRSRARPHVTHTELVRVTEWKMSRGVWRGPNLALVRGNDADLVSRTSEQALSEVPHPSKPVATLATLAGVGPATASAVLAAAAPETYPFFDEIVAAQVPALGTVKFTPTYYARYADALRHRSARLGAGWTPAAVERALWANAGGKAGAA
jgi:hypothetical protein